MVSSSIDSSRIIAALQSLPVNIQNNVLVGGVRAGANIVRDEARARVPVDRGVLKKSIMTKRRRAKKKGEIIFSVSPTKGGVNDGYHGMWVELGTSKMQAQPFLRPALEATPDRVLAAVKDYATARFPKEVEKARLKKTATNATLQRL